MKHIIDILILLTVIASIAALTGCVSEEEPKSDLPEPPDPHQVLEEQVQQERRLREAAETRAAEASSRVKFWEGACAFSFIGACIAFISGTAIGSRGRKHADS